MCYTEVNLPNLMVSLTQQVQQQIALSIGLSPEEKNRLLESLPKLSEAQMTQLQQIFREEQDRKEKLLSDFFEKNPNLFPIYDRMTKQQVHGMYTHVEQHEKQSEEQRLEVLLSSSF